MSTYTPHSNPRRGRVALLLVFAATAAVVPLAFRGGHAPAPRPLSFAASLPTDADDGRDLRLSPSRKPAVEASFRLESYRPGDVASLRIGTAAGHLTLQVWRAGTETRRTVARDVMLGSPVTAVRPLGSAGPRTIPVRVGRWPSGLYFARLTAEGGKVGYAPFVVRPRRLGEHRVAVVLPTQTWQAYNYRDNATWYANPRHLTVELGRPMENRGVPNNYKNYDAPFLRWLVTTGRTVDVLADRDLHHATADELARAYDLIVFSGHHEYVTTAEYDAVEGFRDRGGNLMFLSANNFFWRVDRAGDRTITRVRKWRELGRPESALIGVQYFANDDGEHRGRWVLRRDAARERWLFAGTGLDVGELLSNGGIEADTTTPYSPSGTRVVAEIPDLFGPGMTAQMSYYETKRGAKVFAAGAFTLGGAIWQPDVRRLVENLWTRLAGEA